MFLRASKIVGCSLRAANYVEDQFFRGRSLSIRSRKDMLLPGHLRDTCPLLCCSLAVAAVCRLVAACFEDFLRICDRQQWALFSPINSTSCLFSCSTWRAPPLVEGSLDDVDSV